MKKKKLNKQNNTIRGPIARKLIKSMQVELKKKIINLDDIKIGKQVAKERRETTINSDKLVEYNPLHALYIDAQNKLSVIIESICQLPALNNLVEKYLEREDKYVPSFPPKSPVTTAYFTCWSSFDLQSTGKKPESLATISIDFCKAINADKNLIHVFETMQNTRMGIYRHEGFEDSFIILKEIYSGKITKVLNTTNYLGEEGEIWFLRLMPPIFEISDYSIVFTTPYILNNGNTKPSGEVEWLSYLHRILESFQVTNINNTYEKFMKFGLIQDYWLEFITLAYVNHTSEKIMLSGIPDKIHSLPHGHIADSSYLNLLQK